MFQRRQTAAATCWPPHRCRTAATTSGHSRHSQPYRYCKPPAPCKTARDLLHLRVPKLRNQWPLDPVTPTPALPYALCPSTPDGPLRHRLSPLPVELRSNIELRHGGPSAAFVQLPVLLVYHAPSYACNPSHVHAPPPHARTHTQRCRSQQRSFSPCMTSRGGLPTHMLGCPITCPAAPFHPRQPHSSLRSPAPASPRPHRGARAHGQQQRRRRVAQLAAHLRLHGAQAGQHLLPAAGGQLPACRARRGREGWAEPIRR